MPSTNVPNTACLRPVHDAISPVGRCFLTCLHFASLARFGKPSNYGAKKLASPSNPSANVPNTACLRPVRNAISPVGRCFLTCLGFASLARFGKPSDYGAKKLASLSNPSANVPNTACLRPMHDAFGQYLKPRWPMFSHLFTFRFARSVWKTEQLWSEETCEPSANAPNTACLRPVRNAISPVGRCFLTCLRFASLARFGKPSDYGAKKLASLCNPSANAPNTACLRPVRNAISPLADVFSPVYISLRSLGLENRATIEP